MEDKWISKEDWDFFNDWKNSREKQLAEWSSANGDDRIKILRELYNQIMEDNG